LKLAVSRSRPSVPYGANLYIVFLLLFKVIFRIEGGWLGR